MAAILLPLTAPQATAASPSPVRYLCAGGDRVEVQYDADGSARLWIGGHMLTLAPALSANGARYVGRGWQWWSTGMRTGLLAPLAAGETIASHPGRPCQVVP